MTAGDTPISDPAELEARLAAWPAGAAIALDTEFVRERTYFPQLCLIQAAAGGDILLVDALAIPDGGALTRELLSPARPKILHAARQDIEALLPLTASPPPAVFDTQQAASLLGFPAQVGYAELVRLVLGVTLAKGHARTDWSRRPLSREQLAYAVDDVRYLPALEPYTIQHRWSGPLDLTLVRHCAMGVTGSHDNVYYALGYSGHGITLANLAGQVLTDFYAGERERWRDCAFYMRRPGGIPPEPFRWAGYQLITRLTGKSPWKNTR